MHMRFKESTPDLPSSSWELSLLLLLLFARPVIYLLGYFPSSSSLPTPPTENGSSSRRGVILVYMEANKIQETCTQ